MPEHFSPSPDDLRPEHPELELSNDEFLSDLQEKLERPLSKDELAAQHQAHLDQKNILLDRPEPGAPSATETLDRIDAQEKDADRAARWDALPAETKNLFSTERMIFERIGKMILLKSGDAALVDLSEQARTIHAELGVAYNHYLDNGATEKAFSEAVLMAVGQLEEIEHRLSTHP